MKGGRVGLYPQLAPQIGIQSVVYGWAFVTHEAAMVVGFISSNRNSFLSVGNEDSLSKHINVMVQINLQSLGDRTLFPNVRDCIRTKKEKNGQK